VRFACERAAIDGVLAMNVQLVPIAQIRTTSNVRLSNGFDKEGLSELAESLKTHGMLQPVVLRNATADDEAGPDGNPPFVVIAGRRRIAAAKLAGFAEVPALISNAEQEAAYQMEIAENLQREQMTLADTARAVRTLMMIYDNAKRVGTILNKSPAWVSKHLSLTGSSFSTIAAEMLDRGIVQDLETLILLNQIDKLTKTDPRALLTMGRMIRIAQAGDMNRQIARDALAALKAPPAAAPAPVTTTTTHTKANHTETTTAAPVDPTTHFQVAVPVQYLAAFEQLGGIEWLCAELTKAGA